MVEPDVMIRRLLLLLVAGALTVSASASGPATSAAPPDPPESPEPAIFAVTGVRLFDGDSVRQGITVVVADGRVQAVGTDVAVPDDAEIVDGAGRTLLPGLIDSHTHSWGPALERALVFGVTTQIDQFSALPVLEQAKAEQAAGTASARADLVSAGILATAPGGHGTQYGMDIPTLSTPEEAEAFVAARFAEGSDFLKIVIEDGSHYGATTPTLSAKTVAALVAATHRRDELAVAHVSTLAGARTAIAAGADALVHLFLGEPGPPELIDRMKAQGMFVIPTLTVLESTTGVASGAVLLDDPRLEPYLTPFETGTLGRTFPARGLKLDPAFVTLRRLAAAGVPILAGSDAPNPGTAHGASLHRELELLVAAGLPPIDALRAATPVRPTPSASPIAAASSPGCAPTCCWSRAIRPPTSRRRERSSPSGRAESRPSGRSAKRRPPPRPRPLPAW